MAEVVSAETAGCGGKSPTIQQTGWACASDPAMGSALLAILESPRLANWLPSVQGMCWLPQVDNVAYQLSMRVSRYLDDKNLSLG
jgi:hypothetical protein